MRKRKPISRSDAGFWRYGKCHCIRHRVALRRQQTKSEIATVADQERPAQRLGKRDLDMPQPLLSEARFRRKILGAGATPRERLALQTDRLGSRGDAGMPQRLY